MKVFAENFRGFRFVETDLNKLTFLVGDNSSGKSSILHLVQAVTKDDLHSVPRLDEDFAVSEYDYFSPYFEEADVIFGFYSDSPGSFFAKLITVRKGVNSDSPRTIKCSYFVDSQFLSFSIERGGVKFRILNDINITSISEAIDIHKKGEGWKKCQAINEIKIGDPTFIIAALDYKSLGLENCVEKIFKISLCESRLSAPTRALPAEFYTFKRKFNAQGLHFATMWLDFSGKKSSKPIKLIENFGCESGLFEKINVRRLSSKISKSPLIVTVVKGEKEFLLNQVGVGVSQVVPVLMDCVFSLASKDIAILLQQPELHLHPIAQAAFGSYLHAVAAEGLRGVVETHSSYLLDRFRAELRDTLQSKENSNREKNESWSSSCCEILFCNNTSYGNISTPISISEDGNLMGEPEEYHQFFVDELMRTMF